MRKKTHVTYVIHGYRVEAAVRYFSDDAKGWLLLAADQRPLILSAIC